MADPVKLGNKIPLTLQLSDDDPDAFPQVELRDEVGALLAASPVDLSHDEDGLYIDLSVSMPDVQRVIAVYRVFENAAHTIIHPVHCDSIEETTERDFAEEAKTVRVDFTDVVVVAEPVGEVDIIVEAEEILETVELEPGVEVEVEDAEVTEVVDSDNIEIQIEGD